MESKKTLLFLCVANSARSQMAEGLARKHFGNSVRVMSAGSAPTKVNPFAIAAMKELGISLSNHESKSVASIDMNTIDLVVTLCADEVCPVVPSKTKKIHMPFPDPASVEGNDVDKLAEFRKVRDMISASLNQIKL
jgi:arsenate reductase